MSHLARGYSIIIDEVTKNVNENGVQVVEENLFAPYNFPSFILEIIHQVFTTF